MLKALGVHIYAGGFTLGMRQHFEILGQLESTAFGAATVRRNMPEVPVFVGKESWPKASYLREAGVDLVYANPPCAIWSIANSRSSHDGWKTDPRTRDTEDFFDLVAELQPKVAVVESVPRSLTVGKEFYESHAARLLEQGYAVTSAVTNAQFHGVPQDRRRVFFVAHKVDLDFRLAEPRSTTVGEALTQSGEPRWNNPIPEKWSDLVRQTPQGSQARAVYFGLNPDARSGPGNRLRRPALAGLCPIPTGWPELIHPTEHRHLDPVELQALSGYPRDYYFVAKNGVEHVYQLNRAVLPPVGEWIAGLVARGLDQGIPCLPVRRYIDVTIGGGIPREVMSEVAATAHPKGGMEDVGE